MIDSIKGSPPILLAAKSARTNSRAWPPASGPTNNSRYVWVPVCRSSCFRNGFSSMSSERKLVTTSRGGASGGRSKSSNKRMLSASAHCKSSIKITSGFCLPSLVSISRIEDGIHLQHYRKHARQGRAVSGHQAFGLGAPQRRQVLAQIVHHAVQRFVRNGLALVAAALQDDGIASARF